MLSLPMNPFFSLLRRNHNYRNTWIGQVVSEIGDHFNNVAVFGLVLAQTHSGMVVTGVMLARAIPAILAGPLAGVLLDRFDRKRMMIASDLVRAVVALGFILTVNRTETWLIYLLSGLLMLASPFFTSGRAAILPSIATKEELHTANSLTQTTQWTTLSLGAFLGGAVVTQFGFQVGLRGQFALVPDFRVLHLAAVPAGPRLSAAARLGHRSGSGAPVARIRGRAALHAQPAADPGHRHDRAWAGPPAAARRRFCSAFSARLVFNRGPAGIGTIWGCAGLGLLLGGAVAYKMGPRLSFENYKRTIVICYICHGGSYILFSQMRNFAWALVFIAISRAAVGVSATLKYDAASAARGRRVSRARFRHHRIDAVECDDGVDDAGGNRQPVLGPAHDRRHRGRAEFDYRDILGLGARDGPAARTGARRRGARGDRSPWRADGVMQEKADWATDVTDRTGP